MEYVQRQVFSESSTVAGLEYRTSSRIQAVKGSQLMAANNEGKKDFPESKLDAKRALSKSECSLL